MSEAVAVILRRKDGAVLIQHRDNNPTVSNPNYFGLPGGRTENEHPRQTAARELLEETGYALKPRDFRLVAQDFDIRSGVPQLHSYYLAPYDGVSKIDCFEGQSMKFVQPVDLEGRQVVQQHLSVIEKSVKTSFHRSKERI